MYRRSKDHNVADKAMVCLLVKLRFFFVIEKLHTFFDIYFSFYSASLITIFFCVQNATMQLNNVTMQL
jgi:hypothetical protein